MRRNVLAQHLFKDKAMALASSLIKEILADLKTSYSFDKSEEKKLINCLNGIEEFNEINFFQKQ